MAEQDPHQIRQVEMNGFFETCPECGYDKGFHSIFRRNQPANEINWLLVCPQCGTRFDLGLVGKMTKKDKDN